MSGARTGGGDDAYEWRPYGCVGVFRSRGGSE